MDPSTVYASSGLLPPALEEVSLVASDGGHEWEVARNVIGHAERRPPAGHAGVRDLVTAIEISN